MRGCYRTASRDVAVGGSARRRPDSNRGHHDLTPRGRTVHAHPGLRSVPPRPGDTDSAQPERHLPDSTTGPTQAERGAACHAQSKQRFLGEGGAFLGVALEARTIGSAVRRRARDLGPRSHAVPVLGRSGARPSTRSASRKVLICSGIRGRYAQDERRPARGLRYQLTCLARGRRNDIRANAPAQPPCHSKPPVPTTTAWVTRGPASAPARQAGSAKPTPYSTGIAFGSPSPVTSPH